VQAGNTVMQTIEPLSLKLNQAGFTFTQVFRKGSIAIYEQMKPEWLSPSYELIIIRVRTSGQFSSFKGKRETYPRSSEWGVFGLTFWSLDEATAKADSLLLVWKEE